jgi:hypothetical protein
MCAVDLRNIRGEVTEMIDQCTVLVEKSEQVREDLTSSGMSFNLNFCLYIIALTEQLW